MLHLILELKNIPEPVNDPKNSDPTPSFTKSFFFSSFYFAILYSIIGLLSTAKSSGSENGINFAKNLVNP